MAKMSTGKVRKRRITLEIPGEALLGLRVPLEEAGDVMRMAAAMKLYELGQLSSGAAACPTSVSLLCNPLFFLF
jgi:hypothetical protein